MSVLWIISELNSSVETINVCSLDMQNSKTYMFYDLNDKMIIELNDVEF